MCEQFQQTLRNVFFSLGDKWSLNNMPVYLPNNPVRIFPRRQYLEWPSFLHVLSAEGLSKEF